MGKVKKVGKVGGGKVVRPGPLGDQMDQDQLARPSGHIKIRTIRKEQDDEYVGGDLGRAILKQSVAQLQEIQDDVDCQHLDSDVPKKSCAVKLTTIGDDNSDEEQEVDEKEAAVPQNVDKIFKDFEEELGLSSDDKLFDNFMRKDVGSQRKLADVFREKITEKHTDICSEVDATSIRSVQVPAEVQERCAEVGKVLARYRSGALPKIFKTMPNLRNWEELVHLTDPEKWSAAAVYQATRIFTSNLKEVMVQKFFSLVLLPRVRDDISYYHRLNYHLYQALCKALFKPAAFFKGIVLPLCQSGNCTLREAIIVGSVVGKNHIPIIHSAAAILKIAEMDYNGANSIYLRVFFDKKYALPYRVIDACVSHFLKFRHDTRELPVLWHQALLVFVQRYKEDLSHDQKDELFDVVKFHTHYKITAEVRRELQSSKCRGEGDATDENMIQ